VANCETVPDTFPPPVLLPFSAASCIVPPDRVIGDRVARRRRENPQQSSRPGGNLERVPPGRLFFWSLDWADTTDVDCYVRSPRGPAAGPGPSHKEDPPLCSTHTSNFSAILQELGITTVVFVKFEDAVQKIFPVQVLPGVRHPVVINDQPRVLADSFVVLDEAVDLVPEPLRHAARVTKEPSML
jgi:hypothetical protein